MGAWLTRRLGEPPGEGAVGVTVHALGEASLGPTVVILGAVHGDEGQGVQGALALIDSLAHHADVPLGGRLIVVPVAHEAAAAASARVSPLDGLNLARSFPGDASGSPTQRLAALLEEELLAAADLVVDLHSSGVHYEMASLVGYCDDGSPASGQAADAALAMAMPVTWRHPGPPPPGRSGSGAHARGRPFVYLESSEMEERSDAYRAACLRLLAHAGLLPPGSAPQSMAALSSDPTLRLFGPGDIDSEGVRAGEAGLVEREVGLLDAVTAGQPVARWRSPLSGERRVLVAPRDGRVVMLRRSRLVGPDDLIALVTGEDDRGDEPSSSGRGAT